MLQVPQGAKGTRETLKHMRDMVQRSQSDFSIRDLAYRIVSNVPGKDFEGELSAIYNFVAGNIRYTLDPNEIELTQDPQRTLALGYGDCDDMATLTAALCESLGHPCCLCAVGLGPVGEYSHVLVICSPAGNYGWVAIDTTEPYGPGWFPPGVTCEMIAPITNTAASLL